MTVDSRYRNVLPASESTIVKFTHGSGPSLRTLVLSNGINEIEWNYELISSATPTKGGEVIQILGASIGPVTMSGSTKSSYEMEQIRQWFSGVMHALGTGNHTREDAVLFEYPERGWSFWIVPIQFGPWELNNMNIAAEWHLTAEMVSKTGNSLSDHTMATYVNLPSSSKLAERAFDNWRDNFDPERAEGNFLNVSGATAHKNAVDRTFAGIVSGSLNLFGQSDNPADDRSADDIYEEAFGTKWLYDGTIRMSSQEEASTATTGDDTSTDTSSTDIGKVFKPAATGADSHNYGQDRGDHVHAGTDISMPNGTHLFAAQDGVVHHLSDPPGFGTYIRLDCEKAGFIYGHMQGYATVDGAHVKGGDLIGYSNNTGHSEGPHLHFEVHPGGYKNPQDPEPYIKGFFS